MILVYILFSLTVATILTALCASMIPEQRRGEAFISFFIALLAAAGAVVKWFVPAIAAGRGVAWLPALLLAVFAAILISSAFLSARPGGSFAWAGRPHNNRQDAEAVAFDVLLWVLMLAFGVAVLRGLGI